MLNQRSSLADGRQTLLLQVNGDAESEGLRYQLEARNGLRFA